MDIKQNTFFLISIGAIVGALFRWQIDEIYIVNLIGCFLIGILAGYILTHSQFKSDIYPLLIVGFCGGLTTFSAFALDNYNLIKSNDFFNSILYITLSVVGCIIMIYAGLYVIQKILN